MGLFDEITALDAPYFTDPDLMPGAEALTFKRTNNTTFARNAQVWRFTTVDEAGASIHRMLIGIPNDADNGIALDDFDPRGWQVLISYRGEPASYRPLHWPRDDRENLDSAFLWLEVH